VNPLSSSFNWLMQQTVTQVNINFPYLGSLGGVTTRRVDPIVLP
jgi:hypothetical protein